MKRSPRRKPQPNVSSRPHTQRVRGFWRALRVVFGQRYTVWMLPDSTERGVRFEVSAPAVFMLLCCVVAAATGMVVLAGGTLGVQSVVERNQGDLAFAQANLDAVLAEIDAVLTKAREFQSSADATAAGLNSVGTGAEEPAAPTVFGPASIFDPDRARAGELPDVLGLRDLASTLDQSTGALLQIHAALQSQQNVLRHIPNYWPVGSTVGRVTMEFGPNIHPLTRQWYVHRGFDIAGPVGLPVLASAEGVVVSQGHDPSFGLNVIIRHRFGFYTRYAHMNDIRVRTGQTVEQGQRIGSLGNTGVTTGPHLHFEVWLGDEILDPAPFLMISNEFERGSRRNRIFQ